MKKIISISVVLILVLGLSISSFAFTGIKSTLSVVINQVEVLVNGETTFHDDDVHTILYDGTTYVPLRKCAESIGCKVEYNQETKQANIKGGKAQILAKCIGSYDSGICRIYSFEINGSFYKVDDGDFTIGDCYNTFNNQHGIIDDYNTNYELQMLQ